MALTNEELIEELSNKPIMEVVDLVKALEEKWGVSAAAPVAVAAGPAADVAAVEEQTEFDVVLTGYGENKVPVIKVVRALTGRVMRSSWSICRTISAPAARWPSRRGTGSFPS